MDDFEKELKLGFIEEAMELLVDAEQCFLSLEQDTRDSGVIDKIFRLAHNLKGSAGAVGFTVLADFTHHFESLLLKVKSNEIAIHPAMISLLLECNDYLVQTVENLKNDLNSERENPALIQKMNLLSTQSGEPEPIAQESDQNSETEVSQDLPETPTTEALTPATTDCVPATSFAYMSTQYLAA